jgi:hypothetical protein
MPPVTRLVPESIDVNLGAPRLGYDSTLDSGARKRSLAGVRDSIIVYHEQGSELDGIGRVLDALDLDNVALGHFVLLPARSNHGIQDESFRDGVLSPPMITEPDDSSDRAAAGVPRSGVPDRVRKPSVDVVNQDSPPFAGRTGI